MNGLILGLGALIVGFIVLLGTTIFAISSIPQSGNRRRMTPFDGITLLGVYVAFVGAVAVLGGDASLSEPATRTASPVPMKSPPATTGAIAGSNANLLVGALRAALEYAVFALVVVTLIVVGTTPRVRLTRWLVDRVPISSIRTITSDHNHDHNHLVDHDQPPEN